MRKAPAFQFYPNDWLSSPKIMLMTPAEEGAYIRLLSICWMKGHLPDNDEQLSRLSRLGEGWFNGGSEKLRECFTARNGKLFNERLSKERGKQLKWRQKSREGGRKSAKARKDNQLQHKQTSKGGSALVGKKAQPNANQKATLQSSTSSSTLKEYIYIFDIARKLYPGVKRGLKTEFSNFCKAIKDWEQVLPLLSPAIEQQVKKHKVDGAAGRFVPPWKHFKTWMYNRCWEETTGVTETPAEREGKEQKSIEKLRQLKRKELGQFVREAPEKKLIQVYQQQINMRWLIDELRPEIKGKCK